MKLPVNVGMSCSVFSAVVGTYGAYMRCDSYLRIHRTDPRWVDIKPHKPIKPPKFALYPPSKISILH